MNQLCTLFTVFFFLLLASCSAFMKLTFEPMPMPEYNEKGVAIRAPIDDQPEIHSETIERKDEEGDGVYPTELDLTVSKLFYRLVNFEIRNSEHIRQSIAAIAFSVLGISFLFGVASIITMVAIKASTVPAIAGKELNAQTDQFWPQNFTTFIEDHSVTVLKALESINTESFQ